MVSAVDRLPGDGPAMTAALVLPDAGAASSAAACAAGDSLPIPPSHPGIGRHLLQGLGPGCRDGRGGHRLMVLPLPALPLQDGPPTGCCCANVVVCRLLVGGPSVDRQRPLPPGADVPGRAAALPVTGGRPVDAASQRAAREPSPVQRAASGPAPVLRVSSSSTWWACPPAHWVDELGTRSSCVPSQHDARRCRPNPPVPRLCPTP